jgi:hypothetical protein
VTRLTDYLHWRPRRKRGAAELAARDRAVEPSELSERRDRLSTELAEHQWDLGGLVYEMARRDHFRLDVVVRQAAKLQEVDAELGEVERLLRLDRAGAGGTCPSCGALHARGAVYCWQCGADLMSGQPAGAEAASSGPRGEEQAARPAQAPASVEPSPASTLHSAPVPPPATPEPMPPDLGEEVPRRRFAPAPPAAPQAPVSPPPSPVDAPQQPSPPQQPPQRPTSSAGTGASGV